MAVYALPNKRGYINVNTGRIVIDAEVNDYRKAWVFSEGLAAVKRAGKVGFINVENEVVIPFQFDYSYKCRMWDFAYLFHNGYCIMTNKSGDLGLIDKGGNWVVEPGFACAARANNKDKFTGFNMNIYVLQGFCPIGVNLAYIGH